MYALVPQFAGATDSTPTLVDVTYTLDSEPAGSFTHADLPSSNAASYLSSVQVFKQTGLPEGPHTLTVNVGPGSVFLLDYITYTQQSLFGTVIDNPPSGGTGMNNTTSTKSVGTASGAFSSCV